MECHNIYTEETNNKIKLLRQISYQLRHIDRFILRILFLIKKNDTNHKMIGVKNTHKIKL